GDKGEKAANGGADEGRGRRNIDPIQTTGGSMIDVEGPRCSLRSRKVYIDLSVDYLKMFLLNVPAVAVALGLGVYIYNLFTDLSPFLHAYVTHSHVPFFLT
ncbi:hypothetical protein SOVF_027590, partial [Spinacia oleracea]